MAISAPAIMILFGTVLAAVGALWTSHKQGQFEADLQEKQRMLEEKSEEIISLNRKIAVLSYHTMNMVTGGDSYAYILFSDNQSQSTENIQLRNILLTHEGRYPLYDLNIQIADIDDLRDVKVFTVGNIGSTQHIKHWPLNHAINFDLTEKQSQRFNIFFYSRNGTWYQQMIYKKLEDRWLLATRVVRPNENGGIDVLFKNISPDFPIPENEIVWE